MDRRGFEKRFYDPPVWMMPALIPLSLVYRSAAFSHRMSYRLGFLKPRKLPRPVVCVGNISVGGSGKTPLVIWLAGQLRTRGFRVAILTRGYGSESGHGEEVTVIRDADGSGGKFPGDEPLLISGRLPGVPVYVSAQRYRSGMKALEDGEVDLFLMDDGLQHYALERDLDIVAVDGRRRFGNGRLMPAGILREPVSRLMEADVVVVTKSTGVDMDFHRRLECMTRADVCWSDYRPSGIALLGDGPARKESSPTEDKFLLFSGIADPDSFEDTVRGLSVSVSGRIRYPDHHPYGGSEVREINRLAEQSHATALLTTEKDGCRWPREGSVLPCYVLRMDTVFLQGEHVLLEKVLSLVEK